MECLHRFCSSCIEKCIRVGKKECPSCRIHIPSRRSLRPDPKFDTLVETIYGNVTQREEVEELQIQESNLSRGLIMKAGTNNTDAADGLVMGGYARSAQHGLAIQKEKRKEFKHVNKTTFTNNVSSAATATATATATDTSSSSSSSSSISNYTEFAPNSNNNNSSKKRKEYTRKSSTNTKKSKQTETQTHNAGSTDDFGSDLPREEYPKYNAPNVTVGAPNQANNMNLISFVLRRHPSESMVGRLDREYIRTSCELRVFHLKKFLGLKLQYKKFHDFQVVLINSGSGVVLAETLTLNTIRTTLLKNMGTEFVLHFRISKGT